MFYGFSILQLCAPRSPVCFSQLHVSKAKITASKNSPAAGDAACFDPTIPGLGSPFPVAKLELPDNLRVEPHRLQAEVKAGRLECWSVCKRAAALPSLIPSCGRPRATGLQDWRMGTWKGIPSLPPFVDIWVLHSF